ncbi:PQQ-binding-like beta-propeller repeat protein [Actinoplanes sp. NPDC049599]|uniref:outer membrane protein assembly factor BamB family protein n=1 Tax=Actinoplanes sp. NPDC049599 TaxID=3363903 RepID=UPI0037B1A924
MTGKLLRAFAAVAVLAAAALIGWRVLAPAEVLEPATGAYPVAATVPPGVTGKLAMAPLIVAGSVRVYAGARLVKADGPVEAKTIHTARWSFRRWPERLTGIVAVGTTVVTRWSDGELVALDGRTGKVTWRAAGPRAASFTGRTGSAAVWAPPGLHTAGTAVLVSDGRQLIAHAAADGARRWAVPLPAGCANGFVTTGDRYVCDTGVRDLRTGGPADGWPAGPFTPVGCDVARSGCAGLRDGSGHGWLTGGTRPERTPALDAPDATAAEDLVLTSAGGAVAASRAGREVWRRAGAAQVLGARAGRVALLTPDRRLVMLDLAGGTERAAFPLYVAKERAEPWTTEQWQLTDGHLAVERLMPTASGEFYSLEPVVVAVF